MEGFAVKLYLDVIVFVYPDMDYLNTLDIWMPPLLRILPDVDVLFIVLMQCRTLNHFLHLLAGERAEQAV